MSADQSKQFADKSVRMVRESLEKGIAAIAAGLMHLHASIALVNRNDLGVETEQVVDRALEGLGDHIHAAHRLEHGGG
jgi:hypothetical protein